MISRYDSRGEIIRFGLEALIFPHLLIDTVISIGFLIKYYKTLDLSPNAPIAGPPTRPKKNTKTQKLEDPVIYDLTHLLMSIAA